MTDEQLAKNVLDNLTPKPPKPSDVDRLCSAIAQAAKSICTRLESLEESIDDLADRQDDRD
jgi:hypothetical protein